MLGLVLGNRAHERAGITIRLLLKDNTGRRIVDAGQRAKLRLHCVAHLVGQHHRHRQWAETLHQSRQQHAAVPGHAVVEVAVEGIDLSGGVLVAAADPHVDAVRVVRGQLGRRLELLAEHLRQLVPPVIVHVSKGVDGQPVHLAVVAVGHRQRRVRHVRPRSARARIDRHAAGRARIQLSQRTRRAGHFRRAVAQQRHRGRQRQNRRPDAPTCRAHNSVSPCRPLLRREHPTGLMTCLSGGWASVSPVIGT
jgi:hypothetical protein